MRLPYLQVAMEVIEVSAPELAARGDMTDAEAFYGLVRMMAWARARCPDDRPPSASDTITGPTAARQIALAAQCRGDAEAFCEVCCTLAFPVLERIEGGYRIRGLDRYDAAWRKNHPELRDARGAAVETAPLRSETAPKPERNRSETATVSEPQTQTQTQTHIEAEDLGPAKKPRAPKPPKPVDPRYGPLVGRLKATYLEVVGHPYEFGDTDGASVKSLLGKGTDDEIDRRWRIGLQAGQYGTKAGTVLQLLQRWNELAVKRTADGTGPPKGAATSADTDWSNYKPGDTARELFGDST